MIFGDVTPRFFGDIECEPVKWNQSFHKLKDNQVISNMVILGDIFNVLAKDVMYALGTGSTSTSVHPFDL